MSADRESIIPRLFPINPKSTLLATTHLGIQPRNLTLGTLPGCPPRAAPLGLPPRAAKGFCTKKEKKVVIHIMLNMLGNH